MKKDYTCFPTIPRPEAILQHVSGKGHTRRVNRGLDRELLPG